MSEGSAHASARDGRIGILVTDPMCCDCNNLKSGVLVPESVKRNLCGNTMTPVGEAAHQSLAW